MQFANILLDRLVTKPGQPRTSMLEEPLQALAASIEQHGVLQPIRVSPADAAGYHQILCGHRRAAASRQLGLTEVPCVIVQDALDEASTLAEQLAENIHRENLSPIEEAQGYRRYMLLKAIPASQAAQELAVPPSRISRALPLLELPEDLQTAIHNQTVAKDTAYHLSRLPPGEERERLFAVALTSGLARDSAARAVKAAQKTATSTASSKRVVCQLGEGRSLTVQGLSVRIDAFIEMLEDVLKEARKARTQGFDITTLAKMFRDRAAKGGVA
jgi:ParB family transcriptional regulator, chromosome partitioning protein